MITQQNCVYNAKYSCNYCSDTHHEDDCQKKPYPEEHKCKNCRGKHPADYYACPEYQKKLNLQNVQNNHG